MRWAVPMLCCVLAAPASAQVVLLDDGRWRVTGVADAAAPQIAVSVDEVPTGSFAALHFAYAGDTGFDPVLVLRGDGTLEPRLPGGVPGATASLGSYWDCDTGSLIGPLRFVSLELPEHSKKGGRLELRGQLSNLDSLESQKLRIHIPAPKPDRLRLEFKYRLRATREFCVDSDKRQTDEEFHVVEFDASFQGANAQTNDLTRYVKDIDLDCDFLDCDLERETFCAPLVNETGYVIDTPRRLDDPKITLFHTSDSPAPTPSLEVELKKPRPHNVRPQGFVTESSDPAERNVAFWADWVEVNGHFGDGSSVGHFQFTLEAQPPKDPDCDRTQD